MFDQDGCEGCLTSPEAWRCFQDNRGNKQALNLISLIWMRAVNSVLVFVVTRFVLWGGVWLWVSAGNLYHKRCCINKVKYNRIRFVTSLFTFEKPHLSVINVEVKKTLSNLGSAPVLPSLSDGNEHIPACWWRVWCVVMAISKRCWTSAIHDTTGSQHTENIFFSAPAAVHISSIVSGNSKK